MIRLGSNFTQLRFQRAKFQEVEEKKTEDKKAEDTSPKEENKNDNTNTRKIDLSNFFDQNYLLPINFKPIDTKPTPVVPPKDDEPEVDEKGEETPTTNDDEPKNSSDDKRTTLERNTDDLTKKYLDKLREDEIKAAIKDAVPDIKDYMMNQILSTISSYADAMDSSQIEKAVKELMLYYENDSNAITMAANSSNNETDETLLQETLKSVINAHYSSSVTNNGNEQKNKITMDDLEMLYTTYAKAKNDVSPLYFSSVVYQRLDIFMQSVIDKNNYDVSLDNLKSFFEDVKKNMPTGGAMASSQWLILKFNDFIENGYKAESGSGSLHRESDSLYNGLVGGNNSTSTPENNSTTNGTTAPTPEQLERIRNRINGIVDSTFFD